MNGGDYIMGENLHKKEIENIKEREIREESL